MASAHQARPLIQGYLVIASVWPGVTVRPEVLAMGPLPLGPEAAGCPGLEGQLGLGPSLVAGVCALVPLGALLDCSGQSGPSKF